MNNDYLICNICNKKACNGCKDKYQGKFFKGYAPNFFFRTQVGCDTKPFKFGG